jgi:hypothetical protein
MKLTDRIKLPGLWTVLCLLGMVVGTMWTKYSLPLPRGMVTAIETEPQEEGVHPEPRGSTRQPERPSLDPMESGQAEQR